jgi:hypothetical protein
MKFFPFISGVYFVAIVALAHAETAINYDSEYCGIDISNPFTLVSHFTDTGYPGNVSYNSGTATFTLRRIRSPGLISLY